MSNAPFAPIVERTVEWHNAKTDRPLQSGTYLVEWVKRAKTEVGQVFYAGSIQTASYSAKHDMFFAYDGMDRVDDLPEVNATVNVILWAECPDWEEEYDNFA